MYIYVCVVCLCVILCCESDMCLCAIYICVSMCVVCVYTCDAFVHDHLCVLMTCKVCVVPVGVRMAHVCVDLYVEVWHVFCETPLHEL